jgi:hypothetical protein
VTVTVVQPAVTIASPLPGASISSDTVLVEGTLQAPANSGVTVNGIIARSDGQQYFVNDVPLVEGSNVITVTVTTSGGGTVSTTRTVTRTGGSPPARIVAVEDHEFAPARITLRVERRSLRAIASVQVQNLAPGVLDSSVFDGDIIAAITYAAPGKYKPVVTVTDVDGLTYTQPVAIMALDAAALDVTLRGVWAEMGGRLAAGDIETALGTMSRSARPRYASVLTQIAPALASSIATWSAPQPALFSTHMAEYIVRRTINGVKQAFFVYLLQDENGIWRLDSM